MAEWVATTSGVPVNSHAVAFFGSVEEETRQIAEFVEGAFFVNQPVGIYTSSPDRCRRYREAVATEHPWLVESVRQLPGPHVEATEAGLRPLRSILEFAGEHPRGASLCGDTIPDRLSRETLTDFLTYERWFDTLRPYAHRGLCPYDLRRLPVDIASGALAGLLGSHSHAVLSTDPDPAVQLLQLLIVPLLLDGPPEGIEALHRAKRHGLIESVEGGEGELRLTSRGELLVRALRSRHL